VPEIEFIEMQPPTLLGTAAPVHQRQVGRTFVGLIPAAFALFGAILAAWAPFLPLYTVSEPAGDITDISTDPSGNGPIQMVHVSFDGWGRMHATVPNGEITSDHGIRYGIVLAATAGTFIVAALAIAATAAMLGRSSRTRRLLAGSHVLVIAAIGGATAMSATTYLAFLQVHDSIASDQSASFDGPTNIHVASGGCWLLAGAAAIAGLLAVGSRLLVARFARRDDDVGSSVDGSTDRDVSQTPQSLTAYGGANFSGGEAP
jgi:hypothetical protein